TVLWLSVDDTRTVILAPVGAFDSRRLTLRSSQVGSVPSQRVARWTRRRRLALALSLLRDPAFEVLFSGESAFSALPNLMRQLTATSAGVLCHTLRYN